MTNEQRRIYDALCDEPLGFEELIQRLDMTAADLNAQVTMLELDGLIEVLPGRKLQRVRKQLEAPFAS